MKANKIFFCSLVSFLAVQSMSPDMILNRQKSHGRKPATENYYGNIPSTEAEAELLAKREADEKNLSATGKLDSNLGIKTGKSLEGLSLKKSHLGLSVAKVELASPDAEAEAEAEITVNQPKDYVVGRLNEKPTSVEGIAVRPRNAGLNFLLTDNNSPAAKEITGPCKAEPVGEKLQDKVKSDMMNIPTIVATMNEPAKKIEIVEAKIKEKVKKEKVEEEEDDEKEVPHKKRHAKKSWDTEESAIESSQLLSFMTQLTRDLFLHLDNQARRNNESNEKIFSQMHLNAGRYEQSTYRPTTPTPLTLSERLSTLESRIGIPVDAYPRYNYQNPAESYPGYNYQNPYLAYPNQYSMMPSLYRQQIPESYLPVNRVPATQGYDFNQSPFDTRTMPAALPPLEMIAPQSFIR